MDLEELSKVVAVMMLEVVINTAVMEAGVVVSRFVEVDVDLFVSLAHLHPNSPQLLPVMVLPH